MAVTSVLRILRSVRGGAPLMRSVGELKLWRGGDGALFYRVGNSVVLFKAYFEGRWHAMRCYMCSAPHLAEVYGDRYFAEELFVQSSGESGIWVDVVMEDWVEGVTLKEAVERALELGSADAMARLADGFDNMAAWLLSSDFAHGDLTAENIIVTPDNSLCPIDYDCKFIPQFEGRLSPEIGTAAYQPPSRSNADFDSDIDDYSIALISTALRALVIRPELYHKYAFYDGLLFNPELIARGRCVALKEVIEMFMDNNMVVAYRVAKLLSRSTLRIPSLRDIFCCAPTPSSVEPRLMRSHGYVGYEYSDSAVAIPALYDDALPFREGVAIVKFVDRWLAVNVDNEVVKCFDDDEDIRQFRAEMALLS